MMDYYAECMNPDCSWEGLASEALAGPIHDLCPACKQLIEPRQCDAEAS